MTALEAAPAARQRRARGDMPLAGHLREIRRRLTIVGAAVVVLTVVGWLLTDSVLAALSAPVLHAGLVQDRTALLNFDSVTGPFELRMRIALLLGVILSAPIWLYQIFAFVVPGLSRREKRLAFGFTGTALPLFAAGCGTGMLVLTHMVELLTGFAPRGSATLLQAGVYYEFVLKLLLAMGVAFVLPVFLVVLNFLGVVTGRGILKAWRWALLAIFVFTALTTPAADVLAMFLLAVPMAVLYFAAGSVAVLHDRRRRRHEAALTDAALTEPAS